MLARGCLWRGSMANCLSSKTAGLFFRPFRRDRPSRKQIEDAMKEMTQQQIETPHTRNGRLAENNEDLAKLAQAMRRALKRVANYAMRHDNAAEAANEALALLRAEFVWRFDLLRSRQRQPALIVPKPLPPVTVITC
ncbi:MAG TPA: hypothetical protein VKE94_10830 [Gemmataceae bacterium]|nr:hypothetical protein [Gemmataceae bacterium]